MATKDEVDRVFGGAWRRTALRCRRSTRSFFNEQHELVDVGTCRICGALVVGTWRQDEMGRHVAWHVKLGDELPEEDDGL